MQCVLLPLLLATLLLKSSSWLLPIVGGAAWSAADPVCVMCVREVTRRVDGGAAGRETERANCGVMNVVMNACHERR